MEKQIKREIKAETFKGYTVNYIGEFSFTIIPIQNGIIIKDGEMDENSAVFIPQGDLGDYSYYRIQNHISEVLEFSSKRELMEYVWAIYWGIQQIGFMENGLLGD